MHIVHASDLHLDSPLRGLPRCRKLELDAFRHATRRVLKRLVTLCRERRAAALLLCGDLVDGFNRNHGTGLYFVEQMLKLESLQTQVVCVRGNHDAASRIVQSWLLPHFVRELGLARPETLRFESLGLAVHGASYAHRHTLQSLLASYPDPQVQCTNIGLLHTSLEAGKSHQQYAPCTVHQLKQQGYDYFALGHAHTHQIVSARPWIVYSGTPQGRTIREPGARGAVVVKVGQAGVGEVRFEPLDVVRFTCLNLRFEQTLSLDDVLARVAEASCASLSAPTPEAWVVRLTLAGVTAIGPLLSLPAPRRRLVLERAVEAAGKRPVLLESAWAEMDTPFGLRFRLDGVSETRDVL
jgi:DNA repair exonuclease SbcCD nuclease subunit